jgi:hypothetical protein
MTYSASARPHAVTSLNTGSAIRNFTYNANPPERSSACAPTLTGLTCLHRQTQTESSKDGR